MYAAMAGNSMAAKHLLQNGSNPFLHSYKTSGNKTFLEYAIFSHHQELIVEVLAELNSLYDESKFQNFIRWSIVHLIRVFRFEFDNESVLFSRLVSVCRDVNFTFDHCYQSVKDNNLMHYARRIEDAMALRASGFTAWNEANSRGEIALHSLTIRPNPALIKFNLESGARINHLCERKCPPYFNLFESWRYTTSNVWDTADSILICLDAGADVLMRDKCRCPCSPLGCDITRLFNFKQRFLSLSDIYDLPIWVLELVSLVGEFRDIESAKTVMRTCIRKLEFEIEETAITHVCCHRGGGIQPWKDELPEDDIDEILSEESEFIEMFEEQMRNLNSGAGLKDLQKTWMVRFREHNQLRLADAKAQRDYPEPEEDGRVCSAECWEFILVCLHLS